MWLFHNLLIHSLFDRHLGCYRVLTVKNKAAMNDHVSLSVDRHMFNCIRNGQIDLQNGCTIFRFSPALFESSSYSVSLTTLGFVSLLILAL